MEIQPKSREEILDALHTIQQVCINSDNCCNCPFSKGNQAECSIIANSPMHWNIINKDGPWKAFKD